MKSIIKIAIAEDHTVFRHAFIQSLEKVKDIEVLFGVANGADLLKQMRQTPVDVVLLDLHMPIMDGMAALEAINRFHPNTRVIILSLQYNDVQVRKFMRLGARGYLCKDFEYETVIDAIRDVYHMGYYFYDKVSPELLAELIVSNTIVPRPIEPGEDLTQRELEVIQLMFEEKSNNEIAETMNISIRTVHNHRLSINKKTNSRNAIGVLIFALKNGLISFH